MIITPELFDKLDPTYILNMFGSNRLANGIQLTSSVFKIDENHVINTFYIPNLLDRAKDCVNNEGDFQKFEYAFDDLQSAICDCLDEAGVIEYLFE